jgi:four helix bundle protein
MAFDFRNLEVYKKAKVFHLSSLKLLEETKPTNYVRDQLGRASMSVVLNIAEGSGKFSKSDRRSFFVIARASIFECVAIVDLLYDQNKVKENDFEEFIQSADELSRMLFAMIKNLEK